MKFVDKLLKGFSKFANNYDMTNERILNKYNHSLRVMNTAIEYSGLLGYNDEDKEIAAIIGLLHDMDRFYQISINHGQKSFSLEADETDYAINLLFKEGMIRDFTDREEWYPIIKYAIENHNKVSIDFQGASARMIKHAQFIRDCDKLDIIFGHAQSPYEIRVADSSSISDEIREKFYNKEQINKKDVKTNNERLLIKFSIAFDINNDEFLPALRDAYQEYYKKIENDIQTFKEYYDFVIEYIDERLKEKKGK